MIWLIAIVVIAVVLYKLFATNNEQKHSEPEEITGGYGDTTLFQGSGAKLGPYNKEALLKEAEFVERTAGVNWPAPPVSDMRNGYHSTAPDISWKKLQSYADSYQTYLASPQWQSKRGVALERAGYRCQLCGTSGISLDVHHNSYKRFGDEDPFDLIVLCRSCHDLYHGKK